MPRLQGLGPATERAHAAPGGLSLHRVTPDDATWRAMDAYPDRTVFQTREWVSFVARTQSAEPVVAAVQDAGETVGYFTGLITRRAHLRILGSPAPGWATWYMGFNLREGVSRRAALQALMPFAFRPLGCHHLEIGDRALTDQEARLPGAHVKVMSRVEIDLRRSEDQIWARMSSACRRCVRKAEKSGVVIEEASDLGFADDYYDQLVDVFAKQGRAPIYDRARVRALVAEFQATDRLLLLRARDPEGRCIATGIFPGMGGSSYFWGGASLREHQGLRPNELVMWHAVRHWKARGAEACDLGGVADYPYKRKYGVTDRRIPSVSMSKYRLLSHARDMAFSTVRTRRKVLRRVNELRRR